MKYILILIKIIFRFVKYTKRTLCYQIDLKKFFYYLSYMKKTLLDNLHNDIYCRIKPSKKHGVGVFAIRDIPKNTNPFKVSNGECIKQRLINIKEKEINKLHPEVKKLINDFYHKENKVFSIPYMGINSNDISFYMNTSKKPNIGFKEVKNCSLVVFNTLRKIKKGEELFINYDEF